MTHVAQACLDGDRDKDKALIAETIQTCLGNLCHKTIKGSIRNIFDNSVNVGDDKSVC